MTQKDAWVAGYGAYYEKLDNSDNPHSFEEAEELYCAWEEGFGQACIDDWNES